MAKVSKEIKYDIKKHVAAIGERTDAGWQLELNVISWNGKAAKYDLRNWKYDENGEITTMSKGITMTYDQYQMLKEQLASDELDDDYDEE